MVSVEPDYATDRHISDHIMLTLFTLHARIGVRANIHLGGGADRVLPEWIRWGGGQTEFCPNGFGGGGGVVPAIFRDPYSVGGGGAGVVAEIFRDPYSVGCQNFFS